MNCQHAHKEIALVSTDAAQPSPQLQQHTESSDNSLSNGQQQALEQWFMENLDCNDAEIETAVA